MLRERAINLEERLLWDGSDALLGLAETLRARVERAAWALEDRVVWPLRERAGAWSLPPLSRRSSQAAAAALAALAVGAVVVFFAAAGGGGGGGAPGAHEVAAHVPSPAPSAEPSGATRAAPVLHGAAPLFAPAVKGDARASSAAQAKAPAAHRAEAATPADSSSAATGAAPSQVAGPEAIAAARRFAQAFVLYETGQVDSQVRATFRATTTPQLTAQLLHRPPRLPANVEVPKAKVLNVVPGPQLGDNATVSVSLLRVGLTSELRLSMHREKNGDWLIKDVLG